LNCQHPNHALLDHWIIDHAVAAAFASARRVPAQLAHAASAANDDARLGLFQQKDLKRAILILRQILLHEPREQLGFDETEHAKLYGIAVLNQDEGSPDLRNGDIFLTAGGPSATAHSNNAVDLLLGGSGQNWYFADLTATFRDILIHRRKGEFVSDLGPGDEGRPSVGSVARSRGQR